MYVPIYECYVQQLQEHIEMIASNQFVQVKKRCTIMSFDQACVQKKKQKTKTNDACIDTIMIPKRVSGYFMNVNFGDLYDNYVGMYKIQKY